MVGDVRLLLLLPLLVTGVDVTRATVLCGPEAQTCLEAAGRGWMGAAAVVLVPLYALTIAVGLSRAARGLGAPGGSFARRWLVGTGAVLAATLGQAALSGADLGGGWPALLVLCAAAGALVAVALRVRDAVQDLRPRAPRPPAAVLAPVLAGPRPALAAPRVATTPARGRGPPLA
jgi:hypothetical protein